MLLQRLLTGLAPRLRGALELGRSPYTLLTTFRRDGSPVSVPVWAAMDKGRVYVRSERASGKVRRLARDRRALVAPCTPAGRPAGPPVPASGRVLPPEEEHRAEAALARRYGIVRELFESSMDLMRVDMCYLELTLEPANRESLRPQDDPPTRW